jgi:hypothetical protein
LSRLQASRPQQIEALSSSRFLRAIIRAGRAAHAFQRWVEENRFTVVQESSRRRSARLPPSISGRHTQRPEKNDLIAFVQFTFRPARDAELFRGQTGSKWRAMNERALFMFREAMNTTELIPTRVRGGTQ